MESNIRIRTRLATLPRRRRSQLPQSEPRARLSTHRSLARHAPRARLARSTPSIDRASSSNGSRGASTKMRFVFTDDVRPKNRRLTARARGLHLVRPVPDGRRRASKSTHRPLRHRRDDGVLVVRARPERARVAGQEQEDGRAPNVPRRAENRRLATDRAMVL